MQLFAISLGIHHIFSLYIFDRPIRKSKDWCISSQIRLNVNFPFNAFISQAYVVIYFLYLKVVFRLSSSTHHLLITEFDQSIHVCTQILYVSSMNTLLSPTKLLHCLPLNLCLHVCIIFSLFNLSLHVPHVVNLSPSPDHLHLPLQKSLIAQISICFVFILSASSQLFSLLYIHLFTPKSVHHIHYQHVHMASGINIYSQLLISTIRISDISNSIIDITI